MNNRLMNHQRIGTYYPFNSTENRSVTNFTNCPEIWSNNEVRIEPVDYKTEYMHGIKVYASITVKGPQSTTVLRNIFYPWIPDFWNVHGENRGPKMTAVISFFGIAFVFFRPNIHCVEGPGITVTKRLLNNPDPRTWYKAIHLLIFYIIFIGTIIDSITGI